MAHFGHSVPGDSESDRRARRAREDVLVDTDITKLLDLVRHHAHQRVDDLLQVLVGPDPGTYPTASP